MNRVAKDVAHSETAVHSGQRGHEAGAHASSADHGEHGEHPGQDKHAGHSVAMFRDKFWLSLVLTIPTLVWGHMLPRIFGYMPPEFPRSQWIAPVLGTTVFLYGGLPFVQGAFRELRARLPG